MSTRAAHVDPVGRAGFALFAVVALLPVAFSVGYAVLYSVGLAGLLSEGFTLRYWARLGAGGTLWASFAWSLYVTAASVGVTVALALALALALHRRLQRGPLATLLHLPLAIPATVSAFLVLQTLAPFGLLARAVRATGALGPLDGLPNLVQDRFGIGMIVANAGLAAPFFTLLFAHLYTRERVDDLVRTARTLGASARQGLWRVALPVLLRRAAPNVALLAVVVLGSYEVPLLLDRQAPQMLSVLAMRKFALFDIMQKPQAFVVAVAYTTVVLAGLGLLFRSGRMDV